MADGQGQVLFMWVTVELLWTEAGLIKSLQHTRTHLEDGVSVLKNILSQQQITICQIFLKGAKRGNGILCDQFLRCSQTVCLSDWSQISATFTEQKQQNESI